ncbi:MAG TPA: LysM peptidoglycan-binding domain-containing protein [Candidatus Latescibacteria bacterium]|nr:LysM peptidoglycan-binding domain-containing protein [Candidatus Latescibacterota bacterium]
MRGVVVVGEVMLAWGMSWALDLWEALGEAWHPPRLGWQAPLREFEPRSEEEAVLWVASCSPIPVEYNDRVRRNIRRFVDGEREVFRVWLRRSKRYLGVIREVLRGEGLPEDLAYLAMVESGFNPRAYSGAHAVGIWQFMRDTAQRYGLRVDWWVDERRDPLRSSQAAARFLKDLYREFGDWRLAIAAYNCGPGRLRRAIRRTGTRDFWRLRLPRETSEYVPRFMAALTISKFPEFFGFQEVDYEAPLRFEEVEMEGAMDLRVAARLIGCSHAELEALNPALRRGYIPPYRYSLRVPEGAAERFLRAYAQLPSRERVRWSRHRVRRGDTLWELARAYGTSVRAIMEANRLSESMIRPGQDLLIPGSSEG